MPGDWIVRLDPSPAIKGRTMLDLNFGAIRVDAKGINWGEAAIKAFLAEQLYGEVPADFRVPNRIIEIPLALGAEPNGTVEEEEEARLQLQQKVALFQRQGGVLLRQVTEEAFPLYADIVNASLTIPDQWGSTASIEPDVILKLECLPDFYGDEIELDVLSGEGNLVAVLKQGGEPAVIQGDYPARTRLVLTEESGFDNRGLIWGLRSTHFDESERAKLFYDAKDLTPINGAELAEEFETYSAEWVFLEKPSGEWHPFLTTTINGVGQMTQVGSYRVWARASSTAGQRLRLAWSTDDSTASIFNTPATFTLTKEFQLLDLGEIRLDEPPVGEHWWRGVIAVYGKASVGIDRIWFQPIDDGAGKLRATGIPQSTSLTASDIALYISQTGEGESWNISEDKKYAYVLSTPPFGGTKIIHTRAPFSLPEGVTIHGVKVQVTIYAKEPSPVGVKLPGLETKILYTVGTLSHLTFGGPSDLWGGGITPGEVNEETWGPAIQVVNTTSHTIEGAAILAENYVTVTVYYSYSEGPSEDAVIYGSRTTEIRFDGSYREAPSDESYVRVSEETGDLIRLPPSGLEERKVQLFIKNSRGLFVPEADETNFSNLGAKVIYRPCYIGRI